VIGAKTNQNKPDKLGPSSLETMVKVVLSLYSTIDVFRVGKKTMRGIEENYERKWWGN
jgi:hypothetical protein